MIQVETDAHLGDVPTGIRARDPGTSLTLVARVIETGTYVSQAERVRILPGWKPFDIEKRAVNEFFVNYLEEGVYS